MYFHSSSVNVRIYRMRVRFLLTNSGSIKMSTEVSILEVTCALTMTKLNEFFLHNLVCFILLFKKSWEKKLGVLDTNS